MAELPGAGKKAEEKQTKSIVGAITKLQAKFAQGEDKTASASKVEDTRNLMDNVQYLPTSSRYKIYLIDEVHMLSTKSFNALLKTLKYSGSMSDAIAKDLHFSIWIRKKR